MRSRMALESLLQALDGAIERIAATYCPLDPEAAAQEARLRVFMVVWRKKHVDLEKPPATIRKFLVGMVRNEVRHTQQHLERNGMDGRGRGGLCGQALKGEARPGCRPSVQPLDGQAAEVAAATVPQAPTLPYPLPMYAEYLERTGTLAGASAWIASTYGMDRRMVEAAYCMAVDELKRFGGTFRRL